MNLDRARVRLRERTPTEVADLAFAFVKANARLYVGLALGVGLPIGLVLGLGLGAWTASEPSFLVECLAWAVSAIWIRAPVVLVAGYALFEPAPTVSGALRCVAERRGALLGLVLGRTVLALTGIGLVWDALARYHREEVVLLEELAGRAARARLGLLGRRFGPDSREQLLYHVLIV